jgi:SEC-C motif domain protein
MQTLCRDALQFLTGCGTKRQPACAKQTIHAMKQSFDLADCPCGSGKTYGQCCGVWHQGLDKGAQAVHADTPEALMRSRYSAYVLKNGPYIMATWHISTAPGDLEMSPAIKWLGLQVVAAEQSAEAGVVEFTARFKDNGKAGQLHEISRFVKEAGRWFYIDGQQIG